MEINLYAILDSASNEFGPIFQSKNDATAARSYHMACRATGEEDQDLYRLGSWNTETGLIDSKKPIAVFVTKIDHHKE